MPRSPRVEFDGAFYHVMCRGDRREAVFRGDADCELFLKTLGEACGRSGLQVHAYALMGNHYHLLLETPAGNLVAAMRWLQGTYTVRHNARHCLVGHLFQGRYKAIPIDPAEPSYAVTVADYIHLNPVRAGMVSSEEELRLFPWSSHRWYCGEKKGRPEWLVTGQILEEIAGVSEGAKASRRYREYVEARIAEEKGRGCGAAVDDPWKRVRRGWALGGEKFLERMANLAEGVAGKRRRESYVRAGALERHDEAFAERLVARGLAELGIQGEDLARLKKSDGRKQALAWMLRRKTTVTSRWICERLSMGHIANVARACAAMGAGTTRKDANFKTLLLRCKD